MRIEKCDILVIGSGASGLRAAIEAHDLGSKVIVVGKCRKGDAHTILATGGINAALGMMDKRDKWYVHAADTLKEGWFLADYRAVERLCKNAPQAINDLVKYNVKFARDKRGKLIQRFFGAHTFKRTCFVGDQTGKAMEEAVVRQAVKRKFPFMENIYITTLLTYNTGKGKNIKRQVNGAFGFDMKTGETIAFNAKCVLIATGGHSRLYKRSSSRIFENTGDGISLAFNVGAKLQDMEMLQFHPSGMVYPPEAEGILVTEAVRGEGGRLFNTKNERFMTRYDKERMELGPRDEVARAIYNEIREGRGTPHGAVYLDITHLPKSYIKQRLPKMYRQFKQYVHLDISKDRMEVAPTAHYSMGGIRADLDGFTGVTGLYAVGEVVGGLHGANRLGGNSLAETIVYGRLTGKAIHSAARQLKPLDYMQMKEAGKQLHFLLGKESYYSPMDLKKQLQEVMWKDVGIIRNNRDMQTALKKIEKLKRTMTNVHAGSDIANNENLVALLDVRNLLVAAEAVVRSAMMRKESRGAHFRSDYPKASKAWLRNIICVNTGKSMQLVTAKVAKPKGPIATELKRNRKVTHGFVE